MNQSDTQTSNLDFRLGEFIIMNISLGPKVKEISSIINGRKLEQPRINLETYLNIPIRTPLQFTVTFDNVFIINIMGREIRYPNIVPIQNPNMIETRASQGIFIRKPIN